MDIRSGKTYPSKALSNFAPHPFIIDEVKCASMEGFLQSLKFENPEMQVYVCSLVGFAAKKVGKKKNWQRTQRLWWRGIAYDRHSKAYQQLLDRAYAKLGTNTSFRKALLATGNAVLTHSIGRTNSSETILTRSEFCNRLIKLRNILQIWNGPKKETL